MTTTNELTPRQREIYDFIRGKIRSRGYGPTVREIGEQFGIVSPNGVVCNLKVLERKGVITRDPKRARAITLVEQDDMVTVRRVDLETVREMVAMRIAGPETVELINRMLGDATA